MGAMDADGYLTLKDRSKDVIISGGSNIYPREVEEVLLRHPAVREVAVVGRADDAGLMRVVAVIVPTAEAGADDARTRAEVEIRQAVAHALGAYAAPSVIEWRDELPRLASGKVARRMLRDRP
jgi:long-chain acyl-CoA synthetase